MEKYVQVYGKNFSRKSVFKGIGNNLSKLIKKTYKLTEKVEKMLSKNIIINTNENKELYSIPVNELLVVSYKEKLSDLKEKNFNINNYVEFLNRLFYCFFEEKDNITDYMMNFESEVSCVKQLRSYKRELDAFKKLFIDVKEYNNNMFVGEVTKYTNNEIHNEIE